MNMTRSELVAIKGCTLDGQPASISGARNDFASVQRLDGKGGVVEFAWPTVERIATTHKSFKS